MEALGRDVALVAELVDSVKRIAFLAKVIVLRRTY